MSGICGGSRCVRSRGGLGGECAVAVGDHGPAADQRAVGGEVCLRRVAFEGGGVVPGHARVSGVRRYLEQSGIASWMFRTVCMQAWSGMARTRIRAGPLLADISVNRQARLCRVGGLSSLRATGRDARDAAQPWAEIEGELGIELPGDWTRMSRHRCPPPTPWFGSPAPRRAPTPWSSLPPTSPAPSRAPP